MKNKIICIIVGISIVIACIGKITTVVSSEYIAIEWGWHIYNIGSKLATIIGIITLLANGTFIKTVYFKCFIGFFIFVYIGGILKIVHLTIFANQIIIMGLIGMACCYFLHFVKKTTKKRLDFLKILWVFVSFTLVILGFSHWINRDFIEIGHYLLWVVMLQYVFNLIKNRTTKQV